MKLKAIKQHKKPPPKKENCKALESSLLNNVNMKIR